MKKYKVTIKFAGNCEETATFNSKEEAEDFVADVNAPFSNSRYDIAEIDEQE